MAHIAVRAPAARVAKLALALLAFIGTACRRETTGPTFADRYRLESINFERLPAPQGPGGRLVVAAQFDFAESEVVRSITFSDGGPFADTVQFARSGLQVHMWFAAAPADTATAQLEGRWLDWTVNGQRGLIHYRFVAAE